MKLTKTHKIIIGIAGVTILALATKKYWMPKKKESNDSKTSTANTTPVVPIQPATPVVPVAPVKVSTQSAPAKPMAKPMAKK